MAKLVRQQRDYLLADGRDFVDLHPDEAFNVVVGIRKFVQNQNQKG
jgi:hypothetical protein